MSNFLLFIIESLSTTHNMSTPSKHLSLFFLSGLALAAVSCSASFNSQPYDSSLSSDQNQGITYKLPKTVIDCTASYALYKITRKGKSILETRLESQAADSGPIKLTPRNIGDDEAVFLITTPDLAAFTVATKQSKVEISPDGVLKSVNGSFEDKSDVIFSNVLATGINLAKLYVNPAGVARNDGPEDKEELIMRATASGQLDYARLRRNTPAGKALTYTIPTAYVKKQMDEKTREIVPPLPKVTVTLYPYSSYQSVTTESASEELRRSKKTNRSKFKGLWTRQAASVRYTVSVDNYTLTENSVLIANAGPTSLIPVKSRVFSDRTTSLAFDNGGSVSSHEFTTTSQGERVTKTMKETSETLGTQIPAIKKAEQAVADEKNNTKVLIVAEDRKIEDATAEIEIYKEEWKKLDDEKTGLDDKLGALNDSLESNDEATKTKANAEKLAYESRLKEIGKEKTTLELNIKVSERKREDANRQRNYLSSKLNSL